MSGAACPVAVTPRGYDENAIAAPEVIGVAFDGSPESVPALEAASALAERARALLRVITVHVSRPIGGPHDLGRQATARPDELKLRAVHDAAVVAHSGGTRVEGVFAVGDPARVLTDQSHDLGLLVTGSRGYGPLGAVLAGGTTHELLRTAACPLLILPRGRGLEIVDRHRV